MTDLNDYATRIYEQNKAVGWWDDPDRCLFECLQLISTEVAEATEGERKDLMDDHLPHRKMGEVELADALIRTLDLGGSQGWLYAPCFMDYERPELAAKASELSVGKRHLRINMDIADLATAMLEGEPSHEVQLQYSFVIEAITIMAQSFGYDIIAAVDEKLEYNKSRADHQRANRAQPGGKKF